MSPVIAALVFLCLLGANISVCLWSHRRGYQFGVKEGDKAGYARGRIDADNWWMDAEQHVDQARQKLWKEEQ